MAKFSHSSLILVCIALSTCEAIQFPGLNLIHDCIETKCGVRMRSCLRDNQWEITDSSKGCIARDCKVALKMCVKQIPNDALVYAKAMAKIAEQYLDYGLDVFSDSYLLCWLSSDIDNGTQITDCLVDGMLMKTEPFVNLFGSALFSDPAYMACYIAHSFKVLISTFADISADTDYMQQLEENKEMEMERNLYDYVRCHMGSKWDAGCAKVWNRIYGSPPSFGQYNKDLMIGTIHDLISVTVKCRKS